MSWHTRNNGLELEKKYEIGKALTRKQSGFIPNEEVKMIKLNTGRECPYCGKRNKQRIPRKSWMRLCYYSRLFECKNCMSEYLCIGVITIGTYSGYHKLLTSQGRIR
jgi:hypothetical protein